MKRILPFGVQLLCYVYLINAILYILSIFLFYNNIIILGHKAAEAPATLVRFVFFAIPIYLYFRLRKLKKDAWFVAIGFHIFLLVNSILEYLERFINVYAFIRVTGSHHHLMPQAALYRPVIILALAFNVFIVAYLFKKKLYFRFY